MNILQKHELVCLNYLITGGLILMKPKFSALNEDKEWWAVT